MKIRLSRKRGSALLITLVTTSILGLALASYLGLTRNQNLSILRSQQWNAAIPVLEAGIEEALTHLFYNATNLEVNGWVLKGTNYYKERDLGNSKYVVTISADDPPVIISRGYVRVPLGTNYIDPPRAVVITVVEDPLFAKGIVAKGQIDLNGSRVQTDSFDSGDPEYSTGGRYDPAKNKDSGDVATNSSVIDTLNVWNAKIIGKAMTGPGGNVRLGSNGSVGSKAWHDGGNTGIEPGWSNDDMNVQFPDVVAPPPGMMPGSGSVDGTNYMYVLTGGIYEMNGLNMSASQTMLVTGDAILHVTGPISLSGQSSIRIVDGVAFQLYMSGSTAAVGGLGIINESARAENFYYFGLPSNTDVALTGNATFTGAVYAPEAHLKLGGGGSEEYDFVGGSISKTVKLTGKYQFHYDENLGRVGPRRGYTVDSWNEVKL